ncbi:MAG: hypothetical protein A3A86_03540 [Elusimicrobia bacterium RIFCSPLOWO2_01_FULL_60_11]|nr:MAG: hypothetical protein A3A86_03540 [Elusimicrobia bacterium RIFCSPLOWO2_01_FULL_60_11]
MIGKRTLLFAASVLFFISHMAYASSGASFLKLGVGARASGLGSAYTAVANDVTSLYWNPSGLSRMKRKELSAMHTQLFSDTRYDFVGYAHPTGRGTFGFGAAYLTQGAIEGRSEDRSQASDFIASDLALTAGFGKSVTSRMSLGGNVKMIQSRISEFSATGFALDLGGIWKASSKARVGLSLLNLGTKMNFADEAYDLPLTLSGGAAYHFFDTMLVSADLKHHPYDSRTSFGIGTEFSLISMFSLRAGYLASSARSAAAQGSAAKTEDLSKMAGLGFGMGLKIRPGIAIDYSFTPAGDLGNYQTISLSMKFGK